MVKLPRFGRVRLPQRLTQRWRAALSAQRRWWRARQRARAKAAGGAVLFPAAGHGAIAVETLAGPGAQAPAGPRIAILHATAGSGHKRAAESLAAALSQLQPSAIVREVDTLVFASGPLPRHLCRLLQRDGGARPAPVGRALSLVGLRAGQPQHGAGAASRSTA
jgi:hypothetical protein